MTATDAIVERFENATTASTCALVFDNAEVLPLHRFDLPGAPVSAYRARGFIFSAGHPNGVEWRGPRRETFNEALADLERITA